MNGGSCSLYIEGKGKVSVSIGGGPCMPSISFTGLHGHGAVGYNIARVCEKAAIRCALRSAGFDIPRASIRIEIDGSTLGLEPIKDGIERGLDDLCDEKQAEADLVEGMADRDRQFEHKESRR